MAKTRKEKHFFTNEEIEFIMDNYQNIELEALTVMFNNYFDLDLNKSQLKNKIGSIGARKRNVSDNYGKYTEDMCIWLVSRYYPGCSIIELCDEFNTVFNSNFTKSSIWHKLNRLLSDGIKRQNDKPSFRVRYDEEMIEYLKSNIDNYTYQQLAANMSIKFKANITASSVEHKANRLGIKKSIVIMTDAKYATYSSAFIKRKVRPLGYERFDGNYVLIKIAEPNIWMPKHRYVWIEANGPIPENCNIIFLDGNRKNCDLSNLCMVTNADLGYINTNKLYVKGSPELTRIGVDLAKLNAAVNFKNKNSRKGR